MIKSLDKNEDMQYPNGTAITVGIFDGVHLGHQQIISSLSEINTANYTKLAVTFYPHPDELFNTTSDFKYIQTLQDRIETLKSYGIDEVKVLEFDRELAGTSAEDFINYLIEKFNMKALVLGWDFALGKNRCGNYDVLKALCESKGIAIKKVEAIQYEGEIISSTVIRKAILNGDLDKTKSMLGREYSITDKVAHGDNRGGSVLNFPTANFNENPKLVLPPNGVYAMQVVLSDGTIHPAAANIGMRPTFNCKNKTIEMHILDFAENIYDQEIKITINKFIRPEIKFNSPAELIAQINNDIKVIRNYFNIDKG